MEGINHGDKPPIIAEIPLFQRKRTDDLFASFENKYKKKPLFLARASGRVNLIGEHIDYCGYSVLPMAIEQDILMAVATNTNTELHLSNANSKFR
nr:N-acetylgalactosamine kinase-like [Lytechinus pictus]